MRLADRMDRINLRLMKIEKILYIVLGGLAVQMGKDVLPVVTALIG